jgi:hypothetical protein
MKELSKREIKIMNEAFMVGRVYNQMGEKYTPAQIHEKLIDRCKKATSLK